MLKRVVTFLTLFGTLFFFIGAFAGQDKEIESKTAPAGDKTGKLLYKIIRPVRYKGFIERLNDKVNLTSDQKNRLQSVLEDADLKISRIRTNVAMQLKNMLTEEQRAMLGKHNKKQNQDKDSYKKEVTPTEEKSK